MLGKNSRQKEIEKRMLVRKTLSQMEAQISRLEEQKKVYIEAAREAKKHGLSAQVNLAITGLKMTMAQQKRAQEMLLNFKIMSQMKDMTAMTKEFLSGLSVLSKEMSKLTDSKEFMKVQQQFEVAMGGVQTQTEQMDVYLDMSSSEFSTMSGDSSAVSDDEVNKLIDEQEEQSAISADAIDDGIAAIHKRISDN